MKLVKSISLFIVCLGIFVFGTIMGMKFQLFFYPGGSNGKIQNVGVVDDGRITADTVWEVHSIYVNESNEKMDSLSSHETRAVPAGYIGMNLQELSEVINQRNTIPPLSELNKGFDSISINSFSSDKVELFQYYQIDSVREKQTHYYLCIMNHYVVVLCNDCKTIYMKTNIKSDQLPESILIELLNFRKIDSQKELYAFLESYSS